MPNFIEIFSVIGYKMYESVGNPVNAHHGYQLFYNLTGKATYMISGKKYTLKESEWIIVPPFAEHHYVSSLGTDLITLDIQFTTKDKKFDKNVREICSKVHPQDASLRSLTDLIAMEARKRSGNFYYSVRDLFEIFLLISIDKKQGEEQHLKDAVGNDFERLSECIKRVTRYLEGMVTGSHNFDLNNVAKVVGYSKKYICQSFIDTVGMTIKQYLMMLRIEKAKELIAYTDYTIKEISEILNFTSYVYFSRMFKSYAGMTPLEYRNDPTEKRQFLCYSFRDVF